MQQANLDGTVSPEQYSNALDLAQTATNAFKLKATRDAWLAAAGRNLLKGAGAGAVLGTGGAAGAYLLGH